MDIQRFLSSVFLFNSFTEKEIALLEASTSFKKVRKGEQIFSEGMDATAFFIVVSGKVKRRHNPCAYFKRGIFRTHKEASRANIEDDERLFEEIEELSLKDIKSRLASYLIENSTVENGIVVCHLRYSKKELSSLLGTIPETLSRALAFLKQKNLIIEKGNRIIIPDPDKLKILSP
ncbi:MAG: Crp/Fnr family transcriptional regulator [Nitrospirota bacterium]